MRGIFSSSAVLIAGRVKNCYRCAWLVYPSGVKLLLSAQQESAAPGWRWSLVLFYITFLTPLCATKRSAPPNCKAGTAMREVRTLLRVVSNCPKSIYFPLFSKKNPTVCLMWWSLKTYMGWGGLMKFHVNACPEIIIYIIKLLAHIIYIYIYFNIW